MTDVDVADLTDDELDELQARLDDREIERNTAAPPPRSTPVKFEPWNTEDDWTNLSEVADRLIGETRDVEFVPESHGVDDPDGTVVVTLEHDERTVEVRFSTVRWLNTGRVALHDQYYSKFGEMLKIDDRDWGILQERWLHRYLSTRS